MAPLYGPAEGHWRPVQPRDVAALLVDVKVLWWVAGGWSLDLFLGSQTRSHGDFDVGVLRRDATEAMAGLPGWEFFEARLGMLYRLGPHEQPRAKDQNDFERVLERLVADERSWLYDALSRVDPEHVWLTKLRA